MVNYNARVEAWAIYSQNDVKIIERYLNCP